MYYMALGEGGKGAWMSLGRFKRWRKHWTYDKPRMGKGGSIGRMTNLVYMNKENGMSTIDSQKIVFAVKVITHTRSINFRIYHFYCPGPRLNCLDDPIGVINFKKVPK